MIAGSNPAGTSKANAPLAQLDRVSDYESGGYEFDSCEARQKKRIDHIMWSFIIFENFHKKVK